MTEEILTEAEDTLVGQLKSLFYYPTADFIALTDRALASLPTEKQEEIIRILLSQIGFEQAERRRYIVSMLFGTLTLTVPEQEELVYTITTRPVGGITNTLLPSHPNVVPLQPALSQELIDQAKIFTAVDKSVTEYRGHLYEMTHVGAYYDALKHLASADQQQLADTVQQFVGSIEQTGDRIFTYNPDFPPGLMGLLKKAGLDLAVRKLTTLAEKLDFLTTVLAVSRTIIQNRAQPTPLSDEQARSTLAIWLATVKQPDTATLFSQ